MTTPVDPPESPPADDDAKAPAWYRDQLKRKEEEIDGLRKQTNKQRTQLLESAFKGVGLDPTTGLGKAIAKEYNGDATVEALREFATTEYGYEPPADSSENPMATEIAQAQGRIAGATAEAESVPLQPIDLEIQQAEEKGDLVASMTLKLQKYRQEAGI